MFCNAWLAGALACNSSKRNNTGSPSFVDSVYLPPPFATPSNRNVSKVIAWPLHQTPVAPPGMKVTKLADSLDNPRWLYVGNNGDVFVAMANTISDGFTKTASDKRKGTKSSNTLLLLIEKYGDGIPELKKVFLTGLNRPLGMLILNNRFFVTNTNGLWRYPYTSGQTEVTAPGEKIPDLPAMGYNNHG